MSKSIFIDIQKPLHSSKNQNTWVPLKGIVLFIVLLGLLFVLPLLISLTIILTVGIATVVVRTYKSYARCAFGSIEDLQFLQKLVDDMEGGAN